MLLTWWQRGFSPASVFAGGAAGLWLDQSDISTGFQDSAGGTPQTASGQVTGMRADKRLGSPFGSELGPLNSAAGWTTSESSVAAVGNEICLTTAGTGAFNTSASRSIPTVIGQKYKATGRLYRGTCANTVRIDFGGSIGTNATTTPAVIANTFTAIATSTTLTIAVGGNETGTTAFFSDISIQPWNGNHLTQSTASSRPEWDVISGISSDFTDGTDDGYSTQTFTAGTLTNNMDLFVALKRASAGSQVLFSNGVANASFIGKTINADATSCMAGVGTGWSVFVDGAQVGATNSVTCGQLHTALGTGAYHVLEVRNLDLSAWTQFTVGLYTAFMLNADDAQLVLCPAQAAAVRNSLRTYVGAKAGLSL